jgi:hypothetical protein
MGGIYGVHQRDGLWRHDICTNFHDDQLSNPNNIKGVTSTISAGAVLVLLVGEVMKYVVEVGSGALIYILSFIKIG